MSHSILSQHSRRLALAVAAVLAVAAIDATNAGPLPTITANDKIVDVSVVGTDFRVRLASGRVLSGRDLVGARLALTLPGGDAPEQVSIDAVVVDPLDPTGESLLYKIRTVDPESGELVDLCGPDVAGDRWAFPLRGQWDEEGYPLSDEGFTLTCGDGAQGKCVRWGYKPWKVLPDGTRLAAYHQACIRMVTANYCGNRRTTRDGMLIDYWDNLGIAQPDPDPAQQKLEFEAAWGPNGAVCVAHTRVPEHETLDRLQADCPRLANRLGSEKCSESTAKSWGEPVLLYNRSR